MERFNESQMLELAKIYRDYECLWDVNNAGYKNRSVRERAYEEIAQKLNIPGVTARGVPKKIKNLRSSYHQEIRKIDKSLQSGDEKGRVYTPKVSWFAIADEVLSAVGSKQESLSNNDDNSKNSDNESEKNIPFEHIKMEENSNVSDEEIEDYNMTEIDHTTEHRESEKISTETSSSRFAPYKKPLKHKYNIRKRDIDLNKAIDKIGQIADRISGESNLPRDKRDDEFDVFGKYIALVLRSLPAELAVQAKLNLQKTLSDIQLTAMRRDS
ncbi:uncharacterized protein LOC121729066 [Aricia agestis]|uniref:uncharacterized protein LOC121729066 n=1 Tax=Aricia agestis TaxID=91739 RepID=UPI001C201E32|nr:uncharacterized protein LOC121729066 [Aricia agestis]